MQLILDEVIKNLKILHDVVIAASVGGPEIKVLAQIDTGCTLCGISPDTARQLNLKPFEIRNATYLGGTCKSKMYKIDMNFNGYIISDVDVAEMPSVDKSKILVGLEIICRGELLIKGKNVKFYLPDREDECATFS